MINTAILLIALATPPLAPDFNVGDVVNYQRAGNNFNVTIQRIYQCSSSWCYVVAYQFLIAEDVRTLRINEVWLQ